MPVRWGDVPMSSVKVDEGEPGDAEGWHTVQPGQHQEEKTTENEAVRTKQWLGEGGRMDGGGCVMNSFMLLLLIERGMMYGDVLQPDTSCGYTNLPAMTSNGQLPLKNRPYKMKDKVRTVGLILRTVGLISCVGIRKWSRNPPSLKNESASWKEHSKCFFPSPSARKPKETLQCFRCYVFSCFFPDFMEANLQMETKWYYNSCPIFFLQTIVFNIYTFRLKRRTAATKKKRRTVHQVRPTQGVSSAHYANLWSRRNSNHSETS